MMNSIHGFSKVGYILLITSLFTCFYANSSYSQDQEMKEGELEIKSLGIGSADMGHEYGVSFYSKVAPKDDSYFIDETFDAKIVFPDGSEEAFSGPIRHDSDIESFYVFQTLEEVDLKPGDYDIRVATGIDGEDFVIEGSTSLSVSESEAETTFDQVSEESIEYEHDNANEKFHVNWDEIDEAKAYRVVASHGSGPGARRFRALVSDNEATIEDVDIEIQTIQIHAYSAPPNDDYQGDRFIGPVELEGNEVLHRSRKHIRLNR